MTYVTDDELRGFFNSLRKWSLKGARSAGIKILLELLELTISPENHNFVNTSFEFELMMILDK